MKPDISGAHDDPCIRYSTLEDGTTVSLVKLSGWDCILNEFDSVFIKIDIKKSTCICRCDFSRNRLIRAHWVVGMKPPSDADNIAKELIKILRLEVKNIPVPVPVEVI